MNGKIIRKEIGVIDLMITAHQTSNDYGNDF